MSEKMKSLIGAPVAWAGRPLLPHQSWRGRLNQSFLPLLFDFLYVQYFRIVLNKKLKYFFLTCTSNIISESCFLKMASARPTSTRTASTNLGGERSYRPLEGKLAIVTGASRGSHYHHML